MRTMRLSALALLSVLAMACGKASSEATESAGEAPAAAASQAEATGAVVEVKMIADDTGARFEPAELTVKKGDVVRFVLAMGVHNVSFPAELNAGKSGLPAPSEMLQLPGQTVDVPVTFDAGEYVFQCDPHAALGMVGKLIVQN